MTTKKRRFTATNLSVESYISNYSDIETTRLGRVTLVNNVGHIYIHVEGKGWLMGDDVKSDRHEDMASAIVAAMSLIAEGY